MGNDQDDHSVENSTNSSGARLLTYEESACAVLLYTLISIVATVGNFTVVFTVFKFQRMRTPTNYLIANLAVADMLMAALCIPFSYWPTLILQRWPFGWFLCKFINFSQAVVVMCSAYTLIAISFDRFLAIMCPMKTFWKLTPKAACCVIALIWLLAIIVAGPLMIVLDLAYDQTGVQCSENWDGVGSQDSAYHYSVAAMVVQYFVPLIVLIVTYGGIGLRLWYSKVPGESGKTVMKERQDSVKKMIPTMFIVTTTYAICWCPLNVLNVLLGIYGKELQNYKYILFIWGACHTSAMFNSMVNPIIYVCKNKKFREGFRYVFRWLPGIRYPGPKNPHSIGTSSEITAKSSVVIAYGQNRQSILRIKNKDSAYSPVISTELASTQDKDQFL